MKITIEEKKNSNGYFILADGKYVEFRRNIHFPDYRYLHGMEGAVNIRYLYQSINEGKVEGETSIVVESGEGWQKYFVAPLPRQTKKQPHKS